MAIFTQGELCWRATSVHFTCWMMDEQLAQKTLVDTIFKTCLANYESLRLEGSKKGRVQAEILSLDEQQIAPGIIKAVEEKLRAFCHEQHLTLTWRYESKKIMYCVEWPLWIPPQALKTFRFDVEQDELSYDEVSALQETLRSGIFSTRLLSNFAEKRVSLRYEKGRFVGDVYLEGAHFWRVEAEYYQHISPNNTGSGVDFWKLYIRTILISEIPELSEADLVFSFLERRVRVFDSSGNQTDRAEWPLLTYVKGPPHS